MKEDKIYEIFNDISDILEISKKELLDMGLREFSNLLYDKGLESKLLMTPKEKEDGR